MIITLKNIKHAEFSSQETHCFEATVYVDGKRSFIAKNDGHGGCDYYHPVKDNTQQNVNAMIKKINAELGKEKTSQYNLDNCLEFVVCDLINEYLTDKEIKRVLKKVCCVKNEQLYILNVKPTSDRIENLKQESWWKPEYKILNEMPIEEMRQYFN